MYYPSYKSLNTTRKEEIHEFKYRIHSLIALLRSLETDLNNATSQNEQWTPDTLDVAYNSKCILENTLNILEQYCWLWSQIPEEKLRELDVDAFFKLKDKEDKNMQVTMYLNTMPQIIERLEENFYKIFDELKKRYTDATKEEFKNRLSQKHAEKRQENPEKRLDW